MQATTSGRMANHQPTLLVAGAALVIATTLMVAGVASQNVRLGGTAARPVPNAQAVERALVTVRAGERQGLQPGWANSSATAGGATRLPDKAQGHVGLTELAAGSVSVGSNPPLDKVDGNMGRTELAAPGIAPNLPAGNWGQNQVRTNGSGLSEVLPNGATIAPADSQSHDEILIPANFYAPGVPSVPVYVHKADAALSPSSPSYSELVNQRKGEKYRIQAAEAPDAFNKAGFSIR